LCFIPGVGWVGCGAAAAGTAAVGLVCYLTGICQEVAEACYDAVDRMFNENGDSNRLKGPPKGYWPGDTGATEWGRRHGVPVRDAKDRFHKGIKPRSHTPGARDDLWVNPDTGDVVDASGDYAGNLGDDYN